MGNVIAQTYELIQHIGAGGGGDVYLAKHLRLDKLVVLKADKRKLNTRPELLRREVDVLKDLTHSYIPKVYDFFVENEIVYTVMDYIEGESLDKPLKRGERFSQPQVIEWAKQLLEALEYLHSPIHGNPPRGFVHSDIKPANLMRTPYNTICLIDFNITLALGEMNFIGCSAGYASPEHYGLDYTTGFTNVGTESKEPFGKSDTPTPSPTSKRMVLPDVRSDIYSTGATLYHLLSGKRPAKNASEVQPLSDKEFSPQLVHVISKAMNLNPEQRYQSAAEMRYDLEHLREADPRAKRLHRGFIAAEACMAVILSAGLFASFTGLKRIQATESALRLASDSRDALRLGNAEKAQKLALEALELPKGIFTPSLPAEAERALASSVGIYDLSDSFRSCTTVDGDSEPLMMVLSPDSSSFACMYSGNAVIYSTETAQVITEFPADISALSQIRYIDNDRLLYAGDGAIRAYSISTGEELWSGEPATGISISANGAYAAAVWRDNEYAVVYNTEDGSVKAKIDFGGRKQSITVNDIFIDPHDNLFSLNSDGSMLAVSFSDGSLSVFNTDSSGDEIIINEQSEFTHFEGGFYKQYLVFSAASPISTQVTSIDTDRLEVMWQLDTQGRFSVRTDENGIYLQTDNKLVRIDPVTAEQTPLITVDYGMSGYAADLNNTVISAVPQQSGITLFNSDSRQIASLDENIAANMLAISDSVVLAASNDSNTVHIFKYRDCSDSILLSYDADYQHDEARVSADRKNFMLFSTNGFRIYDVDGSIVAEQTIPDPDRIYDQQFRRDANSSYLEIKYYSGRTLIYSATDGSVISDESGVVPDKSLHEEFITDGLRIESELHGAAKAYDRNSGKLVAELDNEGYLTYVTQLDDGRLVAQYITTAGKFYGVLMNEKCEVLADLPYLCDINGNDALFDLPDGSIRSTHFYTVDELINSARK